MFGGVSAARSVLIFSVLARPFSSAGISVNAPFGCRFLKSSTMARFARPKRCGGAWLIVKVILGGGSAALPAAPWAPAAPCAPRGALGSGWPRRSRWPRLWLAHVAHGWLTARRGQQPTQRDCGATQVLPPDYSYHSSPLAHSRIVRDGNGSHSNATLAYALPGAATAPKPSFRSTMPAAHAASSIAMRRASCNLHNYPHHCGLRRNPDRPGATAPVPP